MVPRSAALWPPDWSKRTLEPLSLTSLSRLTVLQCAVASYHQLHVSAICTFEPFAASCGYLGYGA